MDSRVPRQYTCTKHIDTSVSQRGKKNPCYLCQPLIPDDDKAVNEHVTCTHKADRNRPSQFQYLSYIMLKNKSRNEKMGGQ